MVHSPVNLIGRQDSGYTHGGSRAGWLFRPTPEWSAPDRMYEAVDKIVLEVCDACVCGMRGWTGSLLDRNGSSCVHDLLSDTIVGLWSFVGCRTSFERSQPGTVPILTEGYRVPDCQTEGGRVCVCVREIHDGRGASRKLGCAPYSWGRWNNVFRRVVSGLGDNLIFPYVTPCRTG